MIPVFNSGGIIRVPSVSGSEDPTTGRRHSPEPRMPLAIAGAPDPVLGSRRRGCWLLFVVDYLEPDSP